MTGQDPNNYVSGNQPPTHPTNPSDEMINNHKSGNSQYQVNHRTSKLSSSFSSDSSSSGSSSGPEPTPTPSPAYSASQPSSDFDSSDFDSSSSEDQHANGRHVRFRSYESIRYFEKDVPTKNPPLYPRTHRRKKRFRKKPFPLDTDISCGRSIFETSKGDAIRKYHRGNYGCAEDYFFWDEMLQGQRPVTTLKRSNTIPGSTQRSLTKDEASGLYRFYRFPSMTHDYMMTGNPIDDSGRQSRTIRPFQPTPALFDFNFDKFRIHHQRPEMSRFDVENWLTHAAGLEPPWAGIEPLSLVYQTTSSECSSLSDTAAESTSSYAAELSSAAATDSTSSNAIGHTYLLPISFSQGYSTSNATFSPTSGSSSPKPFKPKHQRRSAPATSTSTRYPQPSQLYQLGAVATRSIINIHVTEGSSAHRQEDNGPPQSNWLTNPSLEDLPALKYRIPRPATVSPILHAVMFAALHGVVNNSSQGKVDDDVPVLNLTSQLPTVPRNAVWEVNTRVSNSNPSPSQKPRTATESEDVRRGEQMDRSFRDSQLQKVSKQILQNDHIQEILVDYYIDEEQVVDEDEHYDKGREAEVEGGLAEGDDDTQSLIENDKGKKKKKKTLLQRVKSAFKKKPKNTPGAS
ncbi:hypothetical protein BGX30_004923 [Mortierella sp. GBA39]|nr:hypothetical protein BGX30_004923 [Mortierella sp. GBA39]